MEKLEQTLALSEDNERPNWIGGIVDALDDAKNTLDVIDSSGALPSSWKKLVTRDDTRRKNSILHLWQEKTHESFKFDNLPTINYCTLRQARNMAES